MNKTHIPAWAARAGLLVLLCAGAVRAQVPAPAAEPPPLPLPMPEPAPVGPETSLVSPAPEITAPTQSQSNPLAPPSQGNVPTESPFRYGSLVFNPHPSYAYFYSEGILAAPGEAVTTSVQSFSPGFLAQIGPIWSLDYTPTWDWYSSRYFHDTFDQNARLAGATTWTDWKLQFSQSYSNTSDPLIETGRQTTTQSYDTDVKAFYAVGAKTSLELGLDQDIRTSPAVPDYYEWSIPDWFHYSMGQGLDAAVGAGLGYVIADPGYDMNFMQPQARITWSPAPALSILLQGGLADWSFYGTDGARLTRPIFTGSIQYQAGEATRLSATAQQDIEVGYSLNQIDQAARYSLGLQQRLLQHFYFGAEVGEEEVTYLEIAHSLFQVRDDRATTLRLSLSTTLFRRLNLAVQYSNLRNTSDLAGYGFLSNQWGVVAGFKY